MTTKVFCDRCGEQCAGLGWRVYVVKEGLDMPRGTNTDLCTACVKLLKKFLDGAMLPEETAE